MSRIEHHCMKVIANIGVIYSKMPGLPIDLRNYLADEMSVQVPGARFMPIVRRGLWDGYKKFFQPVTCSFLTGLIDEVEALLKKKGCQVDRNYEKLPDLEPGCPELPQLVEPRDYQEPIIVQAIDVRRGIIRAAVNAGKTIIALEIIRRLRLTTLYIVPSKELHEQMMDDAKKYLPDMDIGQIKAGTFEPGLLTIATDQSVIKAYPTKKDGYVKRTPNGEAIKAWIKDEVECIIADEVHHSAAEKWGEPFKHALRAQYRFGLSATPHGMGDTRDMLLTGLTGAQFGRITTKELIARGLSVETEVWFIKYDHTGFGLDHYSGLEYQLILEEGVAENHARIAALGKALKKHVDAGERILVMCDTINSGDYARARFQERKIPVQVLYGPHKNRRRIISRFKSAECPVLVTTLLKEGVNIPEIDVIVNLGAKSSSIRTIQQAGRILRTREGKTKGVIYDFIDPAHKLLLNASRNRYKAYKDEGFKVDLLDMTGGSTK
jgi:superfamily II DNA or RNA helicase